ncbi:MAG TPA: helix-turn-helix transcriptional regulator, partial [Candidatus Limnocylindria bacterium]|nr:helix-turn-helix transcriptional regulator [Candidatus Limnocylindria bacterium]
MNTIDALRQGRDSYAERAWQDAYESLSRADEAAKLAPEDVELLATAAYMLGRDAESMGLLERAHRAYADAGRPLPAVRCA